MTVLTTVHSTELDDQEEAMPVHPRRASASGPEPYRALVIGSAAFTDRGATGAGVAKELAARTGHGVDVETVIAAPTEQAADGDLLADRDLSRHDAVIVALETESGPDAPGLDAVRTLVDSLSHRLTVGAALVLVVPAARTAALPPRRLDELADVAREAAGALVPVVRLEDAPGSTAAERTVRWSRAVASATAAALIDPMVRYLPDDHHDEDQRLDALERVPPRDGRWVARFQQIVDEARAVYGTSSAALSIIDADHARYSTRVGFDNPVIPRGQTICNRVLRTYGGLIVGDAQADLRFQRNPDVRNGDVRFYAGYRIETEDGAPLGSLCVFDPEPRESDPADLIALRDLAIRVQRSLWDLQDDPTASEPPAP